MGDSYHSEDEQRHGHFYHPLAIRGLVGRWWEPSGRAEQGFGREIVGPVYEGKKVEIDLIGGYRYNTVPGHGGGLGVRFSIDLSRAVRLEFHWTPNVFPSAAERLRKRGYPENRDPALPWLQGGLGAAAVFYP